MNDRRFASALRWMGLFPALAIIVAGCYADPTVVVDDSQETTGLPCAEGSAACPCFPNQTCSGDLVCTPDGFCVAPSCTPGTDQCPCDDGACESGLECRDSLCRQPNDDPSGSTGTPSGSTSSTTGGSGPTNEAGTSTSEAGTSSTSETGTSSEACDLSGTDCETCLTCVEQDTQRILETCDDLATECLDVPLCTMTEAIYRDCSLSSCTNECLYANGLGFPDEADALFTCYVGLCPTSCAGVSNPCW